MPAFRKSVLGPGAVGLGAQDCARFQAGSELRIEDLSAGGFLSMSGLEALSASRPRTPSTMLRAAVNIFETMNKELDDVGEDARRSESERHMNLSSSWSNYGQALLMAGRPMGEVLPAFFQSMRHAYLGGLAHSFLIALTNIIHYGFRSTEVRRCMRMLQGGIRVADRVGSVQSSIEMRVHLAGFHIDRNEVRAAGRSNWPRPDVVRPRYSTPTCCPSSPSSKDIYSSSEEKSARVWPRSRRWWRHDRTTPSFCSPWTKFAATCTLSAFHKRDDS